MFTIKMQEGVVATSYSEGDKFHIDPMKLLPLERFTGNSGGGGGRGRGGAAPVFVFLGDRLCCSELLLPLGFAEILLVFRISHCFVIFAWF